jgi:hypothetical protein
MLRNGVLLEEFRHHYVNHDPDGERNYVQLPKQETRAIISKKGSLRWWHAERSASVEKG